MIEPHRTARPERKAPLDKHNRDLIGLPSKILQKSSADNGLGPQWMRSRRRAIGFRPGTSSRGGQSPGTDPSMRLSSPLTKSGSSDSLRLRRFGRVIGDGDGAVGGGSGRLDGDVGGDASLAGTRVLRPAAGAA